MKGVILLLLAGLLAGCAHRAPWSAGYDTKGRQYPEICRQNLSWVQADIEYRPRSRVPRVHAWEENLAMTYYNRKPALIVMADDIPMRLKEDVLHHELCHVVAGDWHS